VGLIRQRGRTVVLPVGVATDAASDVYVADYGNSRIQKFGQANQPPVCDAGGPYAGNVGQSIQFIGTGSSDPDGSIASYEWDFGDGAQGSGPRRATPTRRVGSRR